MNGDVTLRVEGLMLERLLERAVSEGAQLSSIRRDGNHALIVDADAQSAAILTALCDRFSLKYTVLSRRGRNAMLLRLKRRATLLAGILTCLTVLTLFLSRIWLVDIEFTGDRSTDLTEVQEVLKALNIRPGMTKSRLDPVLLEKQLAAVSSEFSFVGVRVEGVRLLVEVAPEVPAPELYVLRKGSDLVADRDGVVLSVTVHSGMARVKPGDTVVRGQVLIEGCERITKEETRPVAARGSVVARTWCEGYSTAPLMRPESVRTGKSSFSASLRLMQHDWPLVSGEKYPLEETTEESLPIVGLFVPLEIHRTTRYETRSRKACPNEDELRSRLHALAFADASIKLTRSFPDGCEIADRWIEYTKDAGVLSARAVYEMHTDIAVSRDTPYRQGG